MTKISLTDILFATGLSCLIIFFLSITTSLAANYLTALITFALILALVFFLSSKLGRLCLTPFLILLLLIPYSFFYAPPQGAQPWICLSIMLAGAFIFKGVLRNNDQSSRWSTGLLILVVIYAIYFSCICILRYLNYQNDSSFDVAIYSQIQWSNIHGAFFHTSSSGSNFVTHNSPFLILLSPFYLLYPHPPTLMVLKTLFIAFSAVPFCLIVRNYLNERCVLPLTVGYLFFPFIVGQNFNAPHETCFLPPLLLFSFYFYLQNRFIPYMFLLLICLSVKEHMAMIVVMYGLYAFYQKRDSRWVIAPLVLGIAWGIFSMWLIYHFQKIYQVDPYPAWLIENIKRRFLRPDHGLAANVVWGLRTSIMGHWCNFLSTFLFLSPLCIVWPFFSSIWILGLPELAINLLATIPLSYPTWHYNIVCSIFLILSCVSAIQKFSLNGFSLQWGLPVYKIQELLSWFLCTAVLSHFFLWSDYIYIQKEPNFVRTMNAAIAHVPLSSSVSMTKHLVAYVSDRKDYFLCEDKRKGEYIVLDKGEKMEICLNPQQASHYSAVFNQDGIRVYKEELNPNSK